MSGNEAPNVTVFVPNKRALVLQMRACSCRMKSWQSQKDHLALTLFFSHENPAIWSSRMQEDLHNNTAVGKLIEKV